MLQTGVNLTVNVYYPPSSFAISRRRTLSTASGDYCALVFGYGGLEECSRANNERQTCINVTVSAHLECSA